MRKRPAENSIGVTRPPRFSRGAARVLMAIVSATLITLGLAGSAQAARVRVLLPGGRTRVVDDRYLPPTAGLPDPQPSLAQVSAVTASASSSHRTGLTVPRRLSQLEHAGSLTPGQGRSYLNAWRAAGRADRRLHGTRRSELGAVIATLGAITARHQLTESRLPALFLTLKRNVQWWEGGPLLASGARVEFSGSPLVWEYYPGQGIELQVLGSFGKANGLYSAGPSHYGQLQALLGELIPLAAHRAGGLAWEYYFSFDGGRPPWVSAMAQGTALEALTRAYRATHEASYLALAHRALGILRRRPGAGVAVPEPEGTRFLQYSFAPRLDIINAFLQTLIGLYDYATYSHDQTAWQLFAAGNAEAQVEVPHFDTGAWSLYQPGLEDDLSYHELVTGFLGQLCSRTGAAVYCRTAEHFHAYLHTPPQITQLTWRGIATRHLVLRFRLSKVSHVGIVILRGSHAVLATSARFPYGIHGFSVPGLPRGTYTVHLAATDLAGNFHRSIGSLVLVPGRRGTAG
jgi:hypothetical protein